MPQLGGPENERRGDEIHLRFSRRKLLKYGGYGLAVLGGAGFLGILQRLTSSGETRPTIPTPQLPQPLSPAERAVLPQQLIEKIEKERGVPTPTPEKQRGILFTKEVIIPERWPRGDIRAVVASEDFAFYTGRDGHLVAISLSDRSELWQSEQKGAPLGTEKGTIYLLRDDNRLYALDHHNKGEPKWYAITVGQQRVLQPPGLQIGRDAVFLMFSGEYTASGNLLFLIRKNSGQILWQGRNPVLGIDDKGESAVIRGTSGFVLLDFKTGMWLRAPEIKEVMWSAFFGDEVYGYTMGKSKKGANIVAGKFGQEGITWRTEMEFDYGPGVFPEIRAKANNLFVYEPWKRGWVVIQRSTGQPIYPLPFLDMLRDFFEEVEGKVIFSKGQEGQTVGVGAGGGTEWMNNDLRFNRIAGVANGVVVAVYNDPDGRKKPQVVAFELASGKRRWAPQEIQDVAHKVIVHKDKVVFGTGNNLRILDVNSGKDAISPVRLPSRPAQIMSHKDFLLVATGEPGKVGNLLVIRV